MGHRVRSEVVDEINGSDELSEDGFTTLRIQPLARPSDMNPPMMDADGDIHVARKRMKAAVSEIALRVQRDCFSNKSGVQVWRAAFLLVDFALHHASVFADETILELGCGIGFVSLVLSGVAKLVLATDHNVDALALAEDNLRWNLHGPCRLRRLDWTRRALLPPEEPFGWSNRDRTALERARFVLASDVFYDDDVAVAFLAKLTELLLENASRTAIIATEKRAVFSAATLSVAHLGYDVFEARICRHVPLTSLSLTEPHRTRYTCEQCLAKEAKPFLAATPLPTHEVPQAFAYDRQEMLELWFIHGLVNAHDAA
ncbi:hypothetical protein SDRG_01199 [Saprolegnia diclina VS20]|uniref:Methyltransferase-like protein 22 n=1 Tax=Saprolegnia diclina (strain VS20) TaxID=1156394 RepID=T0QSS6_SAPDV|nr:hypothetical protein SDRG_01199 [Saprolegnia diclina VS20]EQC41224.1 hypothetical protein SDRG_01199 [Saprolegnia diclina VS20]|eukprot:XP_008604938.1 hypothetical protein SDRG_01199 [Saprolegnia diclina VS20]